LHPESASYPDKARHFLDNQSGLDYLFRPGEFSRYTEMQRPHVILLDLRLAGVEGIDVLPVGFDNFKKLLDDLGFYWLVWNVNPNTRK